MAADGTFVSESIIRDVFDSVVERHAAELRNLFLQLRSRQISTSQFSVEMRAAVRDSQLYAAMLAAGGKAQLTQAQFGLAGQRIAVQYAYLQNFIAQIRDGSQPLDGRALVRAQMYVRAAWGTWTVFQQQVQRQVGRSEYRNVLRPAEHCAQCVEQTKLGWQPIGTLIPIGERTCLVHCRCYFQYR